MKAVAVRHPASLSSLSVEDRPEPEVVAGMVKVKWRALFLNFHDYAVVSGMMPADDKRIPVSDGAGEIVAVGEVVTEWAVGDKVISRFFPDWDDGDPTPENTRRLAGDSVDGCAVEYGLWPPGCLTRMPRDIRGRKLRPCPARP